jgi:HSP20 family protein
MANTLTPYRPTNTFARFPDVIDRLFRDSFTIPTFNNLFDGIRVNSNLLETNDTFILQFALPGILDVSKLQIQVVGQQVTIKGVCTLPTFENATYLWHGLQGDEFSEMFTLPTEVDGDHTTAVYDAGILSITLPKSEYAKPRSVKVQMVK